MDQIDFLSIFNNQVSNEIKKATDLLLLLEENPDSPEEIQSLMRIFHTIKGAARAVNINDIKDITHRLEDIFQGISENKISYQDSLINLSLHAIDLIKNITFNSVDGKSVIDSSYFSSLVDLYISGNDSDLLIEKLDFYSEQLKSDNPDKKISTDNENEKERENQKNFEKEQDQEFDKQRIENDLEQEAIDVQDQPKESEKKSEKHNISQKPQELSDALMNLTGEMTVTVGSLDDQRNTMRSILSNLVSLQSEVTRIIEALDTKQNNNQKRILENFRSLCQKQSQSIEMLDLTESRLKFLTNEIDDQITKSRLIEISTIFADYPRIVRDISKELNKNCKIEISGQTTRIDRGVMEMIRTPIIHLIRNSIDHGIESPEIRKKIGKSETGLIKVHAEKKGPQICITISDDGNGIILDELKKRVIKRGDTKSELWEKMSDHEKLQFIFLPGFSTAKSVSETSGRGMGFDIVKTEVEKMGGRVLLKNTEGKGLKTELELPLTLSLTRCILVKGGKDSFFGVQYYAFPENEIDEIKQFSMSQKCTIEGRDAVRINNETLMIYDFASIMGILPIQSKIEQKRMLILNAQTYRIALLVDNIFDEQHIVNRSLDERLGKIPNIEGVTILRDGNVALIVDIKDIIQSVTNNSYSIIEEYEKQSELKDKKDSILVVEDSQTVREVERHFLESAGYEVTTAVNGIDGLNKLKSGHFDLIISDIDMPRMNGLEMISNIRSESKYSNLPVIVVSYKDREADHQKAIDVGVNLYVTKAEFDSANMLEKIKELL